MKHFSDSNPDATYKVFSGEIIFNFNDLSRLLLSDSIKHLKKNTLEERDLPDVPGITFNIDFRKAVE